MNISMLLDMAVSASPDRISCGGAGSGTSFAGLRRRAISGAGLIAAARAPRVVYLGGNTELFPITLFAAAFAGVPIVPLNYRLGTVQLTDLLAGQPAGTLVVCDERYLESASGFNGEIVTAGEWHRRTSQDGPKAPDAGDDGGVAVLLYTSGTSAAPKAAVLRHSHLVSYILGSVEFGSASPSEATLVTVPPYHVAGVANVLSSVYAGRRIVYLDRFDPAAWLELAESEKVTNAMLVPTMLVRIVQYLQDRHAAAPPIRTLAYGGARMPLPVIESALELFPETGFVNAYGLTETSSTIAVLGPEDHRAAVASADPAVRARLGSVGRPVPGLEVEIRGDDGRPLPAGEVGDLWVRGPQVSGEYVGLSAATDAQGWFPTKDLARLDEEGYLFVQGRADDTIIRGGENISPAEVEDVLLRHPQVAECVVVGVPDQEWGQRLAAVVVPTGNGGIDPADVRAWAAARLRSSKTPDDIRIWDRLPETDTGKILRRRVLRLLSDG